MIKVAVVTDSSPVEVELCPAGSPQAFLEPDATEPVFTQEGVKTAAEQAATFDAIVSSLSDY